MVWRNAGGICEKNIVSDEKNKRIKSGLRAREPPFYCIAITHHRELLFRMVRWKSHKIGKKRMYRVV
jgi:hypothetical protein